ncbi:hypothetical protein BC567DRAFT_44127 [Phyllosticta citribraziliensis]
MLVPRTSIAFSLVAISFALAQGATSLLVKRIRFSKSSFEFLLGSLVGFAIIAARWTFECHRRGGLTPDHCVIGGVFMNRFPSGSSFVFANLPLSWLSCWACIPHQMDTAGRDTA